MTQRQKYEMWERVMDAIRKCEDVHKLRAMLLDTLDNAKDGYELAEELGEWHFPQ